MISVSMLTASTRMVAILVDHVILDIPEMILEVTIVLTVVSLITFCALWLFMECY